MEYAALPEAYIPFCRPSDRHHLCGFDLNLSYPQTSGTFPTLNLTEGLQATLFDSGATQSKAALSFWKQGKLKELATRELTTWAKRSQAIIGTKESRSNVGSQYLPPRNRTQGVRLMSAQIPSLRMERLLHNNNIAYTWISQLIQLL